MKHLSGKGSLAQIFLGAPFLSFLFFIMPSFLSCGNPRLFDPPFWSYFDETGCLLLVWGAYKSLLTSLNQCTFFLQRRDHLGNKRDLLALYLNGTYVTRPVQDPLAVNSLRMDYIFLRFICSHFIVLVRINFYVTHCPYVNLDVGS